MYTAIGNLVDKYLLDFSDGSEDESSEEEKSAELPPSEAEEHKEE